MTTASADTRERLVALLSENPGCFVSGEAISGQLDMTRAAVWKHMQALQQAGWPIESATRRGYRIPSGVRLPYSAAGIRLALHERRGSALDGVASEKSGVDWQVSLVAKTDSTSTRLKELAAAGSPEGVALFAGEQTGGRGRLGREWTSRRDSGIWMSVLLRPDLAPDKVQGLTLAASVAVVETIRTIIRETFTGSSASNGERLASEIGIKWPNDILQKGKKLCGILTEMAAEPDRLSHVVIGIGINVSHTVEDFPPELRNSATSIGMMMAGEGPAAAGVDLPDRNRIAALLLVKLSEVYDRFRTEGLSAVLERWRHASLTLGREITVMDPHRPWPARAVDVGDDGRLLVEAPDGTRSWVLSGEIGIR